MSKIGSFDEDDHTEFTGENGVLFDGDEVEDTASTSFPAKRFGKKRFCSIEYHALELMLPRNSRKTR
nr:hypothetical protein [Tanacetum cinerariifolium]